MRRTLIQTRKTKKGLYCTEHGSGNHSSKDCWTLHPELMPDKFKKAASKSKAKQETHAIQPATMKQLKEMFAMAKEQWDKKGKTGHKTVQKTPRKGKKHSSDARYSSDMSDSDQSNHNMENNTPLPSDDETVKKEKEMEEYAAALAKLGQADDGVESMDE